MQTSILGVLPWQKAQNSPFLVSTFVETISGPFAARIATMLVLWIAFASIFASLLGYSRIPYAAALDGSFFSIFRACIRKKNFRTSRYCFSARSICIQLALQVCTVISAIFATRLLVQFIGQAIGLILLHRRWPPERFPFKMWLYPLPAILTMCGWAALFWATGTARKWGLLLIGWESGISAPRREVRQWPFAAAEARPEPEGLETFSIATIRKFHPRAFARNTAVRPVCARSRHRSRPQRNRGSHRQRACHHPHFIYHRPSRR